MRLAHIETRLASFRPQVIDEPLVARASVAMVLHESERDVELLLMQRATRDGDPWSGHMAFPGGRRDPQDDDVVATAVRETAEEVGLDLVGDGTVIGRLDELRAVARHRPLDLVISPVVFALARRAELRLSAREVESALWVPLTFFWSSAARTTYRRTLDGVESGYPAFHYQGYTIWGLTHRILEGFLEIVRTDEVVIG